MTHKGCVLHAHLLCELAYKRRISAQQLWHKLSKLASTLNRFKRFSIWAKRERGDISHQQTAQTTYEQIEGRQSSILGQRHQQHIPIVNNRIVSVSCFIGVFIHYENKKPRKTILIFRQEKRFGKNVSEKTISKNDLEKTLPKNDLEKTVWKNDWEKRFRKNEIKKRELLTQTPLICLNGFGHSNPMFFLVCADSFCYFRPYAYPYLYASGPLAPWVWAWASSTFNFYFHNSTSSLTAQGFR